MYTVTAFSKGPEHAFAWEKTWTRVVGSERSLAKARALADAQDRRATVWDESASETVYTNGKDPKPPTRFDVLAKDPERPLVAVRVLDGRRCVWESTVRVRAVRAEWGFCNRVSVAYLDGGPGATLPAGEFEKRAKPTGELALRQSVPGEPRWKIVDAAWLAEPAVARAA